MVLELSTLNSDTEEKSYEACGALVRNSAASSTSSSRHNSMPEIIVRKKLSKSNGKRLHFRSSSNTSFEMKSCSFQQSQHPPQTSKQTITASRSSKDFIPKLLLDENDNVTKNESENVSIQPNKTKHNNGNKNGSEEMIVNENNAHQSGSIPSAVSRNSKSIRIQMQNDKRQIRSKVEVYNKLQYILWFGTGLIWLCNSGVAKGGGARGPWPALKFPKLWHKNALFS